MKVFIVISLVIVFISLTCIISLLSDVCTLLETMCNSVEKLENDSEYTSEKSDDIESILLAWSEFASNYFDSVYKNGDKPTPPEFVSRHVTGK